MAPLARLAHANVVIVHNVGEFEGLPFINMEYLSGSSLRNLAKGGLLPRERVLGITDQVLAALEFAHIKGFVHRDLKPDNVMVTDDGHVKVVDFGLSLNIVAHQNRLTLDTGKAIGTPLYMAPEQWSSTSVGPLADLWSVGVMVYELLAGRHPFRGIDMREVMINVMTKDHVPLHKLMPEVPLSLSAVVDRLLAKEVEDRFPDAAEVRAALREVKFPEVPNPPVPDTIPPLSVDIPQVPPTEGLVALPAEQDHARRFCRSCDNGVMLLLPGGEFLMGSDSGDLDERPRHAVRLLPFLLDETPITRRQFATFLTMWGLDRDDAGHLLLDPEIAGLERVGMAWEPDGGEEEPVTGITWYGATAYSLWAGMQLPSEAQLEYAFARLADADDTVAERLKLLIGTVRFWCADPYDERAYQAPACPDAADRAVGSFVSIRGISRLQSSRNWSRTRRDFGAPHELTLDLGFRCAYTVRTASPATEAKKPRT
ncbi:MAG: SUMF1/EgtB/PvdO family nonheme iron enzyme [Planctomycetes bacterium]|nr:SUMF1/EgtB/PvdO family nonheme iron enzyme [Planctomycetota bacterium]